MQKIFYEKIKKVEGEIDQIEKNHVNEKQSEKIVIIDQG